MSARTVLVLRTCAAQRRSHGGFQWPEKGPVEAPDWNSEPVCGGGLHGLLWGVGDASLVSWQGDALWLVVRVHVAEIVDLGAKVKFPRGAVVCCGSRADCARYLATHDPEHSTRGAGAGTATAGDAGTATAGDAGTATAGVRGTATAGYAGTATAADGRVSAGAGGILAFRRWDHASGAYVWHMAIVGRDGIEPDVLYRVDEDGRWVRAEEPAP